MISTKHILSTENFAQLLEVATEHLSLPVQNLITSKDLRYQSLSSSELEENLLTILKKLDNNQFSQVGQQRQNIWESAWSEYLQNFSQQEFDLDTLIPRFISANPIVRLHQEYVRAASADFELNFFRALRLYLFQTYLADVSSIYEFGCGSGYNLIDLAHLYPDKKIYGLDWSKSSVEIATLLGENRNLLVKGHLFDFFAPDYSLEIPSNSAVLTMCALEQIGTRHEEFIQFILQKSPQICINMEPIFELYDQNNLVDYVAARYHSSRGYLSGYLPRLKELEIQNKIEILCTQRVYFGSLYHEGYSFIVWRPTR